MDESKDGKGGSAFPAAASNGYTPGMRLLDYFAAKAMQALIAKDSSLLTRDLTTRAYEYATSMLLSRELPQFNDQRDG